MSVLEEKGDKEDHQGKKKKEKLNNTACSCSSYSLKPHSHEKNKGGKIDVPGPISS